MKKLPGILGVALLLLAACLAFVLYATTKDNFSYQKTQSTETYTEYRIHSDKDGDLRLTPQALAHLEDAEAMLHEASAPTANPVSMHAISPSLEERGRGILQKWSHNEDIYTLQENADTSYSILENQTILFTETMYFGADGPILDARSIDGQPAFTYLVSCEGTCQTDTYYQGLVSQQYNVKNPRALFSYDGKVGFVASGDGGDRIFFNGHFVTPAFDTIHTHNCCAVDEILPTVYSNGTLLFYGQRNEDGYIAEVSLNEAE